MCKPGPRRHELARPAARGDRVRRDVEQLTTLEEKAFEGRTERCRVLVRGQPSQKIVAAQHLRIAWVGDEGAFAPPCPVDGVHPVEIARHRLARIRRQHAEGEVGANPRNARPAQVVRMAGPWISSGIEREAGSDRIQVDVPHECQEIAVGIHEDGVIPALEKVPGSLQALLELPCIPARDMEDDLAEWPVRNLYQQVDVVCHPAVGMHARTEVAKGGGDDLVKKVAVCRRAKDVLPMISAKGHMIETPLEVQAQRAGHTFACVSGTIRGSTLQEAPVARRAVSSGTRGKMQIWSLGRGL